MIYLDNGATSFPKPPTVYEAIEAYIKYCGGSAGRGAHRKTREAMEIATRCRCLAAELMGVKNPEEIIFVKNATEGLNTIIKGMVKRGDKVVVSPLEHNAVIRPLTELGAVISVLPLNDRGETATEYLEGLDEDVSLVVLNHVSNVSGAVCDIQNAARLCNEAGVPLVVDCSQSAGHILTDAEMLGVSVVAPGHKGLLGPQGTGIMYLHKIKPQALCFGGTGSSSESFYQPDILPDYYESGTLNMMGISGLLKGIEYVKSNFSSIAEKEMELTSLLREGLGNMNRVKIVAPNLQEYGAVVSFTVDRAEPSDIAYLLDAKYDIAVRSGLHCAPCAHKAYGTLNGGTVRISPGPFNTPREIKTTLDAVNSIINHGAGL